MIINFRYKLISKLGGGISEVFLAEDLSDQNKKVAIKIISSSINDDSKINSLRNEFNILRALNHPNIVRVFELKRIYNSNDQSLLSNYFLVSEYVKGKNLFEFFNTDYSDKFLGDFCIAVVQICEALYYIHQAGLIHFDIRPENILVSYKSKSIQTKLIDFGFSAFSLNVKKGTIGYLAPEIIFENVATHKSDLYSLGATLFYVLERKEPNLESSLTETFKKYDEYEIFQLRENLPDFLHLIIKRLMAKKPEERFNNALEVIDYLPEEYRPKRKIWFVPKFIYPREEEFNNIKNFISGFTDKISKLLIVGEEGTGKSFLISEVVNFLEESNLTYFQISPSQTASNRLNYIFSFIEQIKIVSKYKPNLSDEELDEEIRTLEKLIMSSRPTDEETEIIKNYLRRILIKVALREPFVIIIDDFELLDDISKSLLLNVSSILAQYNVKFILTVSTYYIKDFESNNLSNSEHIILTPLSKDKVRLYLEKAFHFDFPYDEVTDLIVEFTDCYPSTVNEFINYSILEDWLTYDSSGFHIDKKKINEIKLRQFTSQLNELRLNKISKLSLSILKYLACSNVSLTPGELSSLINYSETEIRDELQFLSYIGYVNYSHKGEQAQIAIPALRKYLIEILTDVEAYYIKLANLFESKSAPPYVIAELYEKTVFKDRAFHYYKISAFEASKYLAFPQVEKFLLKAINLTDNSDELKSLKFLLANCYYYLSDYEKTKAVVFNLFDNFTLSDYEKYELNLLVGSALYKKGEVDEAYDYFDLAYKYAQTPEQRIHIDLQQIKMESVLGNYTIVRKKCENLLYEHIELMDNKTLADIYNNLGIVSSIAGHYEDAISYFEKSKQLYESDSEKYKLTQIYLNLGNIYQILGDKENARSYWNVALELCEAFGNLSKKGLILNNLGNSYQDALEYEVAIKYYNDAKNIFETINDNYGYNLSLFNLAETHLFICDYFYALKYVEESIKISRAMLDVEGLVLGLFIQGILLFELYRIKELERVIEELLDIIEENKLQTTHLQYYLYLTGIILYYQKNYEEADIQLSLAQELFSQTDKKFWYSRITLDIMWLKLYKGEYESVIRLFDELKKNNYSKLNKLILGEGYLILGELARRPGNNLEQPAIYYFDKAIELVAQSYIGESTWQILFVSSEEYLRKGAVKKGLELFQQAKNILNYIVSKIYVLEYKNSYLAHVKRKGFLSKINKIENLF